MYLDSELLWGLGLPLLLIFFGIIESRNKYKRLYKYSIKERDYFYSMKSNKEITEFIVQDAIEIGIYVKNCSNTRQIVDTWVYWHNYQRKKPIDISGVGINSFNTNKRIKPSNPYYFPVSLPYNYRCVEIDLKSVSNYNKAKP
ncbi:MAG: hypothetical protein ACON4L_05120 [Flavobacteriaceae bacterium]